MSAYSWKKMIKLQKTSLNKLGYLNQTYFVLWRSLFPDPRTYIPQ